MRFKYVGKGNPRSDGTVGLVVPLSDGTKNEYSLVPNMTIVEITDPRAVAAVRMARDIFDSTPLYEEVL